MRNLTEQNITEAVLKTFAATQSPRLKEIMTSLVKHIHAFVREVELTEEEWRAGIQILTRIKPSYYPIPMDGPVGQMLKATGRHPYRPAHIHFIVSANGYEAVTTELFVEGDAYLDSDAVFGVRNSLVVDFVRHESTEEAAKYGVTAPFYTVEYDFVLQPVS